ncbi:M20/M25/M40 family metallo-hydrolase [Pseudacidobacterium ailaaui]|jgi:acetylornithine deacetylase/succinyl-diaminopimelate desuccinylase-like protein|uniref:M20/M25/M40 family metallo-hydrolase n=1 Tax=Pseudacidobacterium ailaaui TaxID=1382359 RepID=UPI00047A0537|nr:M20/M25/M40 family metallo-hydrolase [Pseudacidobacterium ailaaui]
MRCTAALSAVLGLSALCLFVPASSAQLDPQTRQLSRDIFQQLIEINTTDSSGSVTAASEAMARRLLDAGFPKEDIYIGGPNERKKNLVARIHGTGRKRPILFIGHLDVVEARRSDWTTDPFQFVEKDGYFYGRGTQDMKESDAILVTTFIRLKKEGFQPDRDLVLALTADEEGGASNGVDWLLKNQRSLLDAEYVINPDGGGIDMENGRPIAMDVDATEKLYGDYQLTATNPGGHSSLPVPDNAIYHIADALKRLQDYTFPFELNAVTRAYFAKMSTLESGQTAADMKAILGTPQDQAAIQRLSRNPIYNATMRTTCVATRLSGGHANNALPQTAQANVNCRILPGHSLREVQEELVRIFDDPKITVRYVNDAGQVFDTAPDRSQLPPAALKPEVMQPLEALVQKMWPGTPVVPTMATGASDGIYTNAAGMPTYGISGIALETNDVRAHGKDERVPVASFYRGVEFYYSFVKALSAQ